MIISCDVCEILPRIEPEYILIESPHWSANLRNVDQSLLGTCFITAKRHVPELDQLSTEEDLDFLVIRNGLFRAIRASFSPLTINTSCLKNDAFKMDPDGTPTEAAHVHWHVKPRYTSHQRIINTEIFVDPMPGRYLEPSKFDRHKPTVETAIRIADIIRSKLPDLGLET